MAAAKRNVPTSRTTKSSEEIALAAARQALHEFATSPERTEQLSGVVKEAIAEGVKPIVYSIFRDFGFDTDHPEQIRKDQLHLHTWREFMDFIRQKGIAATVTWLVAGLLAAIVAGTIALVHKG